MKSAISERPASAARGCALPRFREWRWHGTGAAGALSPARAHESEHAGEPACRGPGRGSAPNIEGRWRRFLATLRRGDRALPPIRPGLLKKRDAWNLSLGRRHPRYLGPAEGRRQEVV